MEDTFTLQNIVDTKLVNASIEKANILDLELFPVLSPYSLMTTRESFPSPKEVDSKKLPILLGNQAILSRNYGPIRIQIDLEKLETELDMVISTELLYDNYNHPYVKNGRFIVTPFNRPLYNYIHQGLKEAYGKFFQKQIVIEDVLSIADSIALLLGTVQTTEITKKFPSWYSQHLKEFDWSDVNTIIPNFEFFIYDENTFIRLEFETVSTQTSVSVIMCLNKWEYERMRVIFGDDEKKLYYLWRDHDYLNLFTMVKQHYS